MQLSSVELAQPARPVLYTYARPTESRGGGGGGGGQGILPQGPQTFKGLHEVLFSALSAGLTCAFV